MSEKVNVVKRREIKLKGIFNINKAYKDARGKINSMSYDFTEKEQTVKDLAKGKEILIKFLGERKFDEMTKFHISVDIFFENINNVKIENKILDKGDAKAVMACWLELDYRNIWNANKKQSDYFMYTIEVLFLVIGLNKVEVEREGKKFAMEKGEVEIQFTAYLTKDYKDKWKDSQFKKNLYERFIVKDRILGYKGDIYEDVYSLMSEAKTM